MKDGRIVSINPGQMLNLEMVSDIIDDGKWDLAEISPWILPEEADAILKIPLPVIHAIDSLVWRYCKDGRYSVKSGYHFANNLDSGACNWEWIWKSRCQPTVRHFIWRACKGALSTKETLFKRKCGTFPLCPICGLEEEIVEHVLLFCL